MAYVKIEITVFTNRWDTYAKDSSLFKFTTKEKGIQNKAATTARDLMTSIIRKAIDEKNKAKEEDYNGHSSGRSETTKEKEEESNKATG